MLFDNSNNIWFSYNSILKALGYSDYITQKKRLGLESHYFDTFKNIYSKSKNNKINENIVSHRHKMINEAGLYILLNKSNKIIAKDLSTKLFTEVLPSLRQTGKYILNSNDKLKIQNLNKKLKLKSQKIKLYQQELKRTQKHSFTNKTSKGFIYVIKIKTILDGKDKTCYKIGYTANLEKRLATYRTGNPDIELAHHENLNCNKKQLENCIINLNILKRLKNKTEIICDVPLDKIKAEIEDCKKLLEKHSSS